MLKKHPTKNEVDHTYGLGGDSEHTDTHTHTHRQTHTHTQTDNLRFSDTNDHNTFSQ